MMSRSILVVHVYPPFGVQSNICYEAAQKIKKKVSRQNAMENLKISKIGYHTCEQMWKVR